MPAPPILTTVNPAGGITGSPVDYIESSFVQSSIRPDGQSAVRHVQVKGADEEDFTSAMLGYSVFDPAVPATPLFRFPPESHPRRPNLVARAVDFVRELGIPTPLGPGGTLEYGGTLLTGGVELAVTYDAVPGVAFFYDAQAPAGIDHEAWRFTKVMEKFDIEQRIIPLGILAFDVPPGPQKTVPSPGTQLVPSSVLTIDWYQVPAVLDADNVPQLPGALASYWANTQGRVNGLRPGKTLAQSSFYGCPPLTLYCAAPEKELVTMPDGNLAWNIRYQFYKRGFSTYADAGHPQGDLAPNTTETDGPNWARLIQANGKYRRMFRNIDKTSTDRTQPLYSLADFYNLFRFGLADVVVVG